jgi:hypothetical protein
MQHKVLWTIYKVLFKNLCIYKNMFLTFLICCFEYYKILEIDLNLF